MAYTQAYNNEWVRPVKRGFKFRCCSCRLVHTIDFRVRDNRVEFKPCVDNRATAASRRKRPK